MPNQPFHPDLDTIDVVNLLRACADGIRLQIIEILDDGNEHTCSDLADKIGIPLPTMSHHLKTMREAGLTLSRKDGTTRWTSLRKDELDRRFPGLVEQLASVAREA